MRLREVEKGDRLTHRLLFRFISIVSGMRLPDAARIVMYHRDFYGEPMAVWTDAAMRGESNWSVGERELIAAMVAQWNTCPFCVSAHGCIAALKLGNSLVTSALHDFNGNDIPVRLRTTLGFLEKLSQTPDKLVAEDVQNVLARGISSTDLEDAIAVVALFSITVRCANAFDFDLLDERDSLRAAKRMLHRGYGGIRKTNGRPDHHAAAEALRNSVIDGPGETDVALRHAVAGRAVGGPSIEAPYDELALLVGNASHKVTNELVENVVAKSGNEKGAFELIVTAAVSSGLFRWQTTLAILKGIQ